MSDRNFEFIPGQVTITRNLRLQPVMVTEEGSVVHLTPELIAKLNEQSEKAGDPNAPPHSSKIPLMTWSQVKTMGLNRLT